MTDVETTTEGSAATQFLVHFMLRDKSHSMDASVLHACDGELLGLIKEIGRQLDVELRIETRAYGEGGFEVFLTLVGKHATALAWISTCIVAVVGGAAWLVYQRPLLTQQAAQNEFNMLKEKKLTEQQVQLNDVNLKKARIELRQLEQADAADAPKAPATESTVPLPLELPPTVQDVVASLLSNRKVLKYRSQFYSALIGYEKVTSVSYAQTHSPAVGQEFFVHRDAFNSFVMAVVPADIEPIVYENAEIEIVSPVLVRGAFKWRGLFGKRPIAFDIADENFIARVTGKEVKFQHGTTLICTLRVNRRENEFGISEPYEYIVEHVHRPRPKPSADTVKKGSTSRVKSSATTMMPTTEGPSAGDLFAIDLGER